jgi:poly-beta-1,6-N-acetyl-D-glucosamine biosynthesis protein PgaD
MSESLIINDRRQLHWQHRLFGDASTAALWGFWLWLCRPLIGVVALLAGSGFATKHGLVHVALGGPVSMGHTALALCSTSGSLLLWNMMVERRTRDLPAQALPNYAAYFDLPVQQIQAGRDSKVSVVHHDETGRIVRVETI